MKEQLEVTVAIYGQVVEWYKSAESKAQIILTVLSSFIVFSSGIILTNPDSFQQTLNQFDRRVYILLSLTFLSMMYGLFSAFMCLYSRLKIPAPQEQLQEKSYPEKDMFFFGYHVRHEPEILFNSLKMLDEEKQLRMYSHQIIDLSKNVRKKHQYVNQGFLAVCLSVAFLLVTTVFYLINLA